MSVLSVCHVHVCLSVHTLVCGTKGYEAAKDSYHQPERYGGYMGSYSVSWCVV